MNRLTQAQRASDIAEGIHLPSYAYHYTEGTMRYQGGKSILGKYLAPIVAQDITLDTTAYVEPFMGGLGFTENIAKYIPENVPIILSDVNPALATLYRAWRSGWRPPAEPIGKAEWLRLKAAALSYNPMTAFAACGLSFGGVWFASFAKNTPKTDYYNQAVNSLNRKFNTVEKHSVEFLGLPYDQLVIPDGSVVYCDPPYVGTDGYRDDRSRVFDHAKFWDWVRVMSERCVVYVSEYTVPEDAVVVCRKERGTTMNPKAQKAKKEAEYLVRYDNRNNHAQG